jgi:hypothetical protein
MRNNQITGQSWLECDVCGFDFPKPMLIKHPKIGGENDGYRVCPRCLDKPGHAYLKQQTNIPEEGVTQEVEGD